MDPKADHGERSYKGLGRLKGRSALITGGDSGIGRAVAIAFAREGANVAISHLPEEEEDAAETLRWIEDAGVEGLAVGGDLTNEDSCNTLVKRVQQVFGEIDILVNNAGFQSTHDNIAEFTTDEFDRTCR